MVKKIGLGVLAIIVLVAAAAFLFQRQIGAMMFERAVAQNLGVDRVAGLPDGLHVGLCGTGSPMPNLQRAGPCNVVIAGKQMYFVDMGEGGNEVLNVMGINPGSSDGLLLTHFHSDHIDGIGPLMLFHWTRGSATAPLPIYGPTGVEAVVDGFNAAYIPDNSYRIGHHGEKVVPPSGAGAVARPFAMESDSVTVLERDGLTITAFKVDHFPVEPAVGYRFDYKGRSVCLSGDTAKSAKLEAACKGADIIVHEALNTDLVEKMRVAADSRGQPNAAKIFHDIKDYHASPAQAAESATAAGARMLVLSHLVPPLPTPYLYPAFLGDAPSKFDGPIVVGEDGMLFSLEPEGEGITRSMLL